MPEAIFCLVMAKWKIATRSTREWMPVSNMGNGNGKEEKVETDRKQQISAGHPAASSARIKSVARVVEGLGRRVPWQSACLDQALAAHYMFKGRKIPHTLHFGVKKESPDEMLAHAWLSVNENIVVGERMASAYREVYSCLIV
jgi:hypothetical protein